MTDLVAFFRARLDDDQRAAEAASPAPWSSNAEGDEVVAVDGEMVCEGFALSGRQLRATVEHIARHDPTSAKTTLRRSSPLCTCSEALSPLSPSQLT